MYFNVNIKVTFREEIVKNGMNEKILPKSQFEMFTAL